MQTFDPGYHSILSDRSAHFQRCARCWQHTQDPLNPTDNRMKSGDSVFTTKDRGDTAPALLLMLACIVLACGIPSGLANRINHDYWRHAALVAIPAAAITARMLQRLFFGRWYKPRYEHVERQMGPRESWTIGIFFSVVLVLLATFDFVNLMNQVTGVPYVANYRVADKYISRGKHTCYGLTIVRVGNPSDQASFCVSQANQDAISTGDVLQVSGRRSQYIDQLLTYVDIR